MAALLSDVQAGQGGDVAAMEEAERGMAAQDTELGVVDRLPDALARRGGDGAAAEGTVWPKWPKGTSGASGCVVPAARSSARAPVVLHRALLEPSGRHRESISDANYSTSSSPLASST